MSSIRLATAANVRALHDLALALNTGDNNPWAKYIDPVELEDEIGRFRVWSGNLGALQRGHSSLDYRLRDSPLLSSNALKFLKELEDNINEALAIVSGARLPYELQPKSEDPEADEEEDDDFFDADDDDEESENRSELSMRFAEIVDIIDNLYTLSVRIRTPTIRSRSLKAATYQPKDPETGVDLLSIYAKYDFEYIKDLLFDLRQPQLAAGAESSEHDYLIARLSAAITLRRRQFKYWKRHRDKLGSTILEEQPELSLPLKRPDPPLRNDTLEAQPGTPGIPIPEGAPSHKTGKTLLSGTEATQHHQSLDEIVDNKSVTSYAVTVKDMHGKGVELPPPPRAADGEKDFECSYCYIICPARYGRGRAWRTHLLQDLQPYVCTFPDCDSSEQLFRSRREWVEHEASHRKAWRCPEHPAAVYKTSAGLEDHLQREHGDSIPNSQLPAIVKVGETTTVDLRTTCPICCVHVDTEGLGDFHNHIANHLERIATFALPSGMEEDSDGASSEASRGRSDSRSSRNISDLSSVSDDSVEPVEAEEVKSPEDTLHRGPSEGDSPALLSAQALSELPDASQSRLQTLFEGQKSDDEEPLKIDTTVNHEKYRLRDGPILSPLDVPTLLLLYRSRQLLQRDQSFAPNDSYNRIISFCYHDLTRIRVDGIVNSVSRVVRMTSGDTLNNAVHRAAGPALAKEARSLGKPTPDHAIVTGGFQLPSKHVIHTFRPRSMEKFDQLVDCYQSAFRAATAHGMKTLAFPCIGTGGIGFPPRVAARLALETTRKWLDTTPNHGFERILFCVNTAIDEKAYVDFLPVYFPPTHSDLDVARSSVWSEDRSALATRVLETQTRVLKIYEGLESGSSLSALGFPEVVLRAINDALASIRRVLLWSQDVTQSLPDINLICSIMQSFCGSVTEVIALAKDQPSDDSVWTDFASEFRLRHSMSISQLLGICEEFVVSLEFSITGRSKVAEHMTSLRQSLERYKARASESGKVLDHLNEVLYTREFQRETISHNTRDTVKLHQIPSVAQLYKLGELEEKLTMAHPSAMFNDCVCFAREDLTRMEVDVIVNSTDVAFSGAGTLNRSVLKKGGIELQDAVRGFGMCTIGDVKVTDGYALPAKHIVHVIPPDQVDKASKDILRKVYREALQAAVTLRATSIAIPSIGTGMLNYPRRDSASLALEEVKRFLETAQPNSLLEKIVFVVYSSSDEFIYRSMIPVYFPPLDLNANRGYPQSTGSESAPGVPKRTLFDSVSAAVRSVRFGKLSATSRSITANEEHALINFESHAQACETCRDIETLYLKGRDLCGEGYILAQRLLWHMNMQPDQTIRSKPDTHGQRAGLDVPTDLFPICTTLLATIEKSHRDAGRGRPFVSPNRPSGAIVKDQTAVSVSTNVETDGDPSDLDSNKSRAYILAYSPVSQQWESMLDVGAQCDIRVSGSTIDILNPITKQSLKMLRLSEKSSVERHKTAPEVLLSDALDLVSRHSPRGTLMFRCPTDSECSSLLRIIRHAIAALQTEETEVPLATRILESLKTDLVERPGSYIGQSTDRIITTLQTPSEEIRPKLAELKASGAVYNTIDEDTWVVSDQPKDLSVLSDEQREASRASSQKQATVESAESTGAQDVPGLNLISPTPPVQPVSTRALNADDLEELAPLDLDHQQRVTWTDNQYHRHATDSHLIAASQPGDRSQEQALAPVPAQPPSSQQPLSNLAIWIMSYMPQEVVSGGTTASHENVAQIMAAQPDTTVENIQHALQELRIRTKSYSISGTLMGPQLHPDYLISDNRNALDDWTCIHKIIVDPRTLREASINFEDRQPYVVLRRSLEKGELMAWAARTHEIRQLQGQGSVDSPLRQEHKDQPVTDEASIAPVANIEDPASSTIDLTSKKVLTYLLDDPLGSFRGAYRANTIADGINKSEDEVSPALHELEKMGKVHVVGSDWANWWAATTDANPGRTTDQEQPHGTVSLDSSKPESFTTARPFVSSLNLIAPSAPLRPVPKSNVDAPEVPALLDDLEHHADEADVRTSNESPRPKVTAILRDPSAFSDTPPSPITGPSYSPTLNVDTVNIDSLYIQPSPSNPQWTRIDKVLVDPRVLIEADEAFYDMGDNLEVHRVLRRGEIERWAEASVAIREKDKVDRRTERSRRDEYQERLDRVIAGDMQEKELRRFRDDDRR